MDETTLVSTSNMRYMRPVIRRIWNEFMNPELLESNDLLLLHNCRSCSLNRIPRYQTACNSVVLYPSLTKWQSDQRRYPYIASPHPRPTILQSENLESSYLSYYTLATCIFMTFFAGQQAALVIPTRNLRSFVDLATAMLACNLRDLVGIS